VVTRFFFARISGAEMRTGQADAIPPLGTQFFIEILKCEERTGHIRFLHVYIKLQHVIFGNNILCFANKFFKK